ncbi:unnamed protein product [Lactuca saligna]|uniref:RRM domain-containing protein n=1 Tax=Lactuca saligna TaxID=75948 RepID=A0AA35VD12_LACSI|nr:unnamed protein product [Lactuca saligna]
MEPRGFGFVQFLDPAEAKYQMDGQILMGRHLTVVFAEENRKKPTDMRQRERRDRSGRPNDRRRSPPPRYSRSPPPRYARSRSHSREYSPPPKRKQHARSISPREKRHIRERLYSQSPVRPRSPPYDGPPRSRSRSPPVEWSPPPYNGSRSPSRSPVRDRDQRGAPRDRGRSPVASGGYSRGEADVDVSPSP